MGICRLPHIIMTPIRGRFIKKRPCILSLTLSKEKGFWGLRGQCLANFRYLKGPIYSWSYSWPFKNTWSTITLQLHNINRMNLFSRSISYTYLDTIFFKEIKFDLQITIDRVHPVQSSSRSDYCITTVIIWKTLKLPKKQQVLRKRGLVPTVQPEPDFSWTCGFC